MRKCSDTQNHAPGLTCKIDVKRHVRNKYSCAYSLPRASAGQQTTSRTRHVSCCCPEQKSSVTDVLCWNCCVVQAAPNYDSVVCNGVWHQDFAIRQDPDKSLSSNRCVKAV